jgi:signal transduction histidine kinase
MPDRAGSAADTAMPASNSAELLASVRSAPMPGHTEGSQGHTLPAAEQGAAKIMVIDDEPINVKVVCKYLKEAGFRNFVTTSDSCQAIAILERERPDLVLLDIVMPGIGGLEILQLIRAGRGCAQVPVVILTAIEDRAVKTTALELGATDFLTKPVDPTELVPRVHNSLAAKAYQDRLQNNAEELERQVQVRTAELLAANESLKELAHAAEAATRAKSEFLANMSHEVRTPLTAILGFADLLVHAEEAEDFRQPDFLDACRTIRRNGQHLLHLLNDVLDISKIEAGKLAAEPIRCSPAQVVADVDALMCVTAREKDLAFDVRYEGPIPETICTDPTRLRQILLNLVSNAIKFTDAGSVCLRMQCTPGDAPTMQFDVLDTGIGMTADQAGILFQAFAQLDCSLTRRFQGTGLGLFVSKKWAELLGGKICIVASQPGAGSHFRLTIPTGPLTDVRWIDGRAAAPYALPQAADRLVAANTPCLNRRILMAEDGPDNQRLIRLILRKAGAEVTVVENGQLALEAMAAARSAGAPFDLVLMDMQMPVMDGYRATKLLREAAYRGPIIALTAHAMAGDRQKCLDAGCDDYASKPIDRQRLLSVLAYYLKRLDDGAQPLLEMGREFPDKHEQLFPDPPPAKIL